MFSGFSFCGFSLCVILARVRNWTLFLSSFSSFAWFLVYQCWCSLVLWKDTLGQIAEDTAIFGFYHKSNGQPLKDFKQENRLITFAFLKHHSRADLNWKCKTRNKTGSRDCQMFAASQTRKGQGKETGRMSPSGTQSVKNWPGEKYAKETEKTIRQLMRKIGRSSIIEARKGSSSKEFNVPGSTKHQ